MHPRSIPRLEPYSLPARSSRGIKRTVLLGACHRWSGKVRSKGPFGPGDCWRVPPACVPDLEQTAEPMSLANAEPACPHCSSAVRQGAAPERGLAPRRPHYGAALIQDRLAGHGTGGSTNTFDHTNPPQAFAPHQDIEARSPGWSCGLDGLILTSVSSAAGKDPEPRSLRSRLPARYAVGTLMAGTRIWSAAHGRAPACPPVRIVKKAVKLVLTRLGMVATAA